MTQAMIMLTLDLVVATLLATTIVYCLKLNKRIRVLQDSKSELAQLIQKFDASTHQATHSIAEIHQASRKITDTIKAKLEKANYIADDLSFMIEKGNKLADRMEGQISSGRGGGAKPRPELASRADSDESDMERGRGAGGREKKSAALDSMLEKMSIGKASDGQAPVDGRRKVMGARIRSQAEQELYEALKAKH